MLIAKVGANRETSANILTGRATPIRRHLFPSLGCVLWGIVSSFIGRPELHLVLNFMQVLRQSLRTWQDGGE